MEVTEREGKAEGKEATGIGSKVAAQTDGEPL